MSYLSLWTLHRPPHPPMRRLALLMVATLQGMEMRMEAPWAVLEMRATVKSLTVAVPLLPLSWLLLRATKASLLTVRVKKDVSPILFHGRYAFLGGPVVLLRYARRTLASQCRCRCRGRGRGRASPTAGSPPWRVPAGQNDVTNRNTRCADVVMPLIKCDVICGRPLLTSVTASECTSSVAAQSASRTTRATARSLAIVTRSGAWSRPGVGLEPRHGLPDRLADVLRASGQQRRTC